MKRMPTDDAPPTKRVKISHKIFDDPQLERHPDDILANGLEDDSGYLSCRCFMTWRPTTKHKAIIETTGSTPRIRFDVEFSGACANFFSEIELKAQDEFLLALKSAQVEQGKQSRLSTIPLKLVYEEGVVIKFGKRQGPCELVDTWHLQDALRAAENANNASIMSHEDFWFLTPPERPSVDVTTSPETHRSTSPSLPRSPSTVSVADHPLKPRQDSVSLKDVPLSKRLLADATPPPKLHRSAIPSTENAAATGQSSIKVTKDPEPPKEPKLPKKEKKRLAREERALQRLASESEKQTVASPSINAHPEPRILLAVPQPPVISVANTLSVPSTSSPPTFSGVEATGRASPSATFGSTSAVGRGRYYKLAASKDIATSPIFSVIGVVVQANPLRTTRNGDWSCSLRLVDPSTSDVEGFHGPQGFPINSFTRKYEQWLPRPTVGEVLIMRGLKASPYRGMMGGVGYHGKLQWAIYSPTTGKIHHGELQGAPESESLVSENFGDPFSPFYAPDVEEIRQCIKMADWWQESQKRDTGIDNYRITGPSNVVPVSGEARRQHRLISEAGPFIPPSGYFDCTVEVLSCHLNDTGVHSLYVTDYTLNKGVAPTQAAWCPPGLADYILKIEAWNDVVQVTSAGEYYSISNAQMRFSRGGYVEGKVNDYSKLRRVDVDEESTNLQFKALLERKKAWEDGNAHEGQASDFAYSTISEVEEGKYFHCVVEVLHAIHESDGASCIYVTDYTHREALVTGKRWNNWGADLDGRILRIALFNNQAEVAKSVQVGSFYEIKRLRLKHSAASRQFQGQLGGVERLVFLLNPNRSDDKLEALKRRKEEWNKTLMTVDVPNTAVQRIKSEPIENDKVAQAQSMRGKTIAELQADKKYPRKTRIFARVVDFRPWKLTEAMLIHCTHCKRDLPPLQKACFDCGDIDHDFVQYMFQMYFLLQDEDGSQLYVSVHDGSLIFDGLPRGNIVEGTTLYKALSSRLSALLGKLLELHSGPIPAEKSEVVLPVDTPTLSCIIDTWEADGKAAHALVGCDLL